MHGSEPGQGGRDHLDTGTTQGPSQRPAPKGCALYQNRPGPQRRLPGNSSGGGQDPGKAIRWKSGDALYCEDDVLRASPGCGGVGPGHSLQRTTLQKTSRGGDPRLLCEGRRGERSRAAPGLRPVSSSRDGGKARGQLLTSRCAGSDLHFLLGNRLLLGAALRAQLRPGGGLGAHPRCNDHPWSHGRHGSILLGGFPGEVQSERAGSHPHHHWIFHQRHHRSI